MISKCLVKLKGWIEGRISRDIGSSLSEEVVGSLVVIDTTTSEGTWSVVSNEEVSIVEWIASGEVNSGEESTWSVIGEETLGSNTWIAVGKQVP